MCAVSQFVPVKGRILDSRQGFGTHWFHRKPGKTDRLTRSRSKGIVFTHSAAYKHYQDNDNGLKKTYYKQAESEQMDLGELFMTCLERGLLTRIASPPPTIYC